MTFLNVRFNILNVHSGMWCQNTQLFIGAIKVKPAAPWFYNAHRTGRACPEIWGILSKTSQTTLIM